MRRLIPVALAGVLALACTDAFTPSGVAGTYALVSLNGNPIPYVESEGTSTVSLDAGSLVLTDAGTYTLSFTVTLSDGSDTFTVTLPDNGTFTLVEPDRINLVSSEGETISGIRDGDRITYTEDGDSLVFER